MIKSNEMNLQKWPFFLHITLLNINSNFHNCHCPVTGGFALLAASSIASNVAGGAVGAAGIGAAAGGLGAAAGVIPALAGLGVVGTAGAGAGAGLMALAECMRPVLCVAPSGQCCLTTMTRRGLVCPPSC